MSAFEVSRKPDARSLLIMRSVYPTKSDWSADPEDVSTLMQEVALFKKRKLDQFRKVQSIAANQEKFEPPHFGTGDPPTCLAACEAIRNIIADVFDLFSVCLNKDQLKSAKFPFNTCTDMQAYVAQLQQETVQEIENVLAYATSSSLAEGQTILMESLEEIVKDIKEDYTLLQRIDKFLRAELGGTGDSLPANMEDSYGQTYHRPSGVTVCSKRLSPKRISKTENSQNAELTLAEISENVDVPSDSHNKPTNVPQINKQIDEPGTTIADNTKQKPTTNNVYKVNGSLRPLKGDIRLSKTMSYETREQIPAETFGDSSSEDTTAASTDYEKSYCPCDHSVASSGSKFRRWAKAWLAKLVYLLLIIAFLAVAFHMFPSFVDSACNLHATNQEFCYQLSLISPTRAFDLHSTSATWEAGIEETAKSGLRHVLFSRVRNLYWLIRSS